ncbi:MAG: hypothetical protein C0514_07505 [Candidatus Puniceispirillum sp.]|nr:hypothetical protein [Candidatus Puniceispirillum sp.]
MNIFSLALLTLFFIPALHASSLLDEKEIGDQVAHIQERGAHYSFEEFKGLILPHLDPSLHERFESGFGALYAHADTKERLHHSAENRHIACFFRSIAGKDLEIQEITLDSFMNAAPHTKILQKTKETAGDEPRTRD